jgi:hypothetical protein
MDAWHANGMHLGLGQNVINWMKQANGFQSGFYNI